MAVAVQMDFRDATLEQYDRVIERMRLTPRGRGPRHAISHHVAETDQGLRVVDVWETREAFDRFAEEQIGPFAAEAGMSAPQDVTFFEVHNYFTPGAQQDEQALIQLDDAVLAAWDRHDADALLALFADDFVWRDVAVPEPITTEAAVRDYVDTWFTAFPDMQARSLNRVIGEGAVAAELEFTGTNTGPLRMGDSELPAVGVSVVGHGAYIFRVRDGRIVEFSSYPDLAGLLMQLGAMPSPAAAEQRTQR